MLRGAWELDLEDVTGRVGGVSRGCDEECMRRIWRMLQEGRFVNE